MEPAEADPVGQGGVAAVVGVEVVHFGELGWPVAVVPGAVVLLRGNSSALSGAVEPLGASCVDRGVSVEQDRQYSAEAEVSFGGADTDHGGLAFKVGEPPAALEGFGLHVHPDGR